MIVDAGEINLQLVVTIMLYAFDSSPGIRNIIHYGSFRAASSILAFLRPILIGSR